MLTLLLRRAHPPPVRFLDHDRHRPGSNLTAAEGAILATRKARLRLSGFGMPTIEATVAHDFFSASVFTRLAGELPEEAVCRATAAT